MCADMTLETNIPVVRVPRTVIIQFPGAIAVQVWVGSPDAVGIAMTPRTRACRIGLIVAGGAVLGIAPGRVAVTAQPSDRRMFQRHAKPGPVAVVAERPGVVTGLAIQPIRFGIKSMGVLIIQVMNLSGQVVAPMAGKTTILILVAGQTPFGPVVCLVGMLKPPVGRMNISQRHFARVTQTALIGRFGTVVTGHACAHRRHGEWFRCCALTDSRVTGQTTGLAIQVRSMTEDYLPFGQFYPLRLVGRHVTGAAGLIFGYLFMALGTDIHRGKILIIRKGAGLYRFMAGRAFQIVIDHVKLV